MKITVDQIMSWGPCTDYPIERVRSLIGRGKTPVQILRLPIPPQDQLWCALRDGVISDRVARLFAAECAQFVAHLCADDKLQGAIDAAVAYAYGHIDRDDMAAARAAAWDAARGAAWNAAGAASWNAARAAARDAACNAAWDAAGAAARAAAWNAACNAAWNAAWDAAWDAAWAAQINGLIWMIEHEVDL